MRHVVEDVLRLGLSSGDGSHRESIKIKPFRLGLKPAYQGMSMNQLYDQLEAEDALSVKNP